MKVKTAQKILDYVHAREGCCTTPMLWADRFPKATLKTVRAHVQTLLEAGRLQYSAPGEHVHPETLELTPVEHEDRRIEARVKSRK